MKSVGLNMVKTYMGPTKDKSASSHITDDHTTQPASSIIILYLSFSPAYTDTTQTLFPLNFLPNFGFQFQTLHKELIQF